MQLELGKAGMIPAGHARQQASAAVAGQGCRIDGSPALIDITHRTYVERQRGFAPHQLTSIQFIRESFQRTSGGARRVLPLLRPVHPAMRENPVVSPQFELDPK